MMKKANISFDTLVIISVAVIIFIPLSVICITSIDNYYHSKHAHVIEEQLVATVSKKYLEEVKAGRGQTHFNPYIIIQANNKEIVLPGGENYEEIIPGNDVNVIYTYHLNNDGTVCHENYVIDK